MKFVYYFFKIIFNKFYLKKSRALKILSINMLSNRKRELAANNSDDVNENEPKRRVYFVERTTIPVKSSSNTFFNDNDEVELVQEKENPITFRTMYV